MGDIDGFEEINPVDQEYIRNLINSKTRKELDQMRGQAARVRTGMSTPQKRSAPGIVDDFTKPKKPKLLQVSSVEALRKGDRVWTYCRVRAAAPAAANGAIADVAVKSAKPELGVVREEVSDGSLVIQFESAEAEKDRIEKYRDEKCRIKSWLRYPRFFEGKKQRIPVKWIDIKKTPPKLCGCTKQEWNHFCECGVSCGRGVSQKVYGLDRGEIAGARQSRK